MRRRRKDHLSDGRTASMMSLSGNVTHICVDIHDFQSRRRIEEIVCRDIDHVLD